MNPSKPTSIKRSADTELTVTWNDGKTSTYSFKQLRDACPCAVCKGETILFKTYKPNPLPIHTPGMYDLKKIEQVGTYAIKIIWGDGHDTGIYSFEYLKGIGDRWH
jgi:DUF971 family protein